jgi:minimal PKS acyl carrier protein
MTHNGPTPDGLTPGPAPDGPTPDGPAHAGPITLSDLVSALRTCAGEVEDVDLGGDIAECTFTDLGYDSIALLETLARLADRHGLVLGEDVLTDLETPAELLRRVNRAAIETREAGR